MGQFYILLDETGLNKWLKTDTTLNFTVATTTLLCIE